MIISPRSSHPFWISMVWHNVVVIGNLFVEMAHIPFCSLIFRFDIACKAVQPMVKENRCRIW